MRLRGPRQRLEPHLAEVTVGRERVGQSKLTHNHKAGAIGEREILVAILSSGCSAGEQQGEQQAEHFARSGAPSYRRRALAGYGSLGRCHDCSGRQHLSFAPDEPDREAVGARLNVGLFHKKHVVSGKGVGHTPDR